MLVHELSIPDSHGNPFMSWRSIFFLFGLIGLLWAAVWYWWFRDEPSQHRQVNAAELAHIMAGRKAAAAEERSPLAAARPLAAALDAIATSWPCA